MERVGGQETQMPFFSEAFTNGLRTHELLTKPPDQLFTAHHKGEDGPGPTSLFIFII